MKVLKYLIGIAAVGALALFGLKYYTQGTYGELPGAIDQLNPLVSKGEVYVKTQKPEEVNGYGTARYVQTAADSEGHKRTIEFNGISVLKEGHYLKISNKGAHVETYEEVSKNDVPAKALAIIE
ncbi:MULTISPECIES: YxeA family protein [unclassified Enterococcus]|uniref:YxeA family protein n=1 Tax=unclassified Enterococcus TaxID=2608891 RepID=UPI0013EB7EA1|nr:MULTISPECIES: YxeA family protein [unclassified Enterococcus]